MKTNQMMKREFLGNQITQRTDNGYFNATELIEVYNSMYGKSKRFKDFYDNGSTKEFLIALTDILSKESGETVLQSDVLITTKGRNGSTYMHPYLFIEFAAWLNAEFRVQLYKWIYDNLIKVRKDAGAHYVEMGDAITKRYQEVNNSEKPDRLVFIKEANYLKSLAFGYKDKERNEATEAELKLLDALQLANIKLLQAKIQQKDRWVKLRDFALMYS